MASHSYPDDLSKDEHAHNPMFFNPEELPFSSHNVAQSSLSLASTTSSNIHPRDALITVPPAPLELRQNNPQDCSNLIIASVNRATVEISRYVVFPT